MTPAEALLVADHGGDYKAACLVLAEEVRRLCAILQSYPQAATIAPVAEP